MLPEKLALVPGSVDFLISGLKARDIVYLNTHQIL